MRQRVAEFIENIIWLCYLALAVITPLLFSTKNSELFEVPKMHFIYFAAVIIFFGTLLKFVIQEKIIIPPRLPIAAFLIFLMVQTFSTLISIDKFTSVFGYPSRLNGGLISQLAYFAIFGAALVNLNIQKVQRLLLAVVLTGAAVSVWGIPSHFGYDPSCFVLTGKFDASCWQAEFDPTIRIFSTLGQPNWLASYLVIIMPMAIAFALDSRLHRLRYFLGAIVLVLFTALLMTNSRAGMAGLAVGLAVFLLMIGFGKVKQNLRILGLFLAGFLILTFLFGGFLYLRFLAGFEKDMISHSSNNSNLTPQPVPAGGTESSEIRLIVWRGAWDVFKKRPILGFGPETFAYSYYLFRPLAHNQTTEWNFFYNKAHNEFLNYLANIGILGFFAYIGFLGSVILPLALILKKTEFVAIGAILAAIFGYHTAIFFGFSTAASQLLMFMLLACGLILGNDQKLKEIKINFGNILIKNIVLAAVIVLGLFCLIFAGKIYFADLLIARAQETLNLKSLLIYDNAISMFPAKHPFYLADSAYENALYAAESDNEEKITHLTTQADSKAQAAEDLAPNNLIVIRRAANTYLLLISIDEQYKEKALLAGQKIINLASHDPQSFLTLAKIQASSNEIAGAKKSLKTALDLKPNYLEAQEFLEQVGNRTVDK